MLRRIRSTQHVARCLGDGEGNGTDGTHGTDGKLSPRAIARGLVAHGKLDARAKLMRRQEERFVDAGRSHGLEACEGIGSRGVGKAGRNHAERGGTRGRLIRSQARKPVPRSGACAAGHGGWAVAGGDGGDEPGGDGIGAREFEVHDEGIGLLVQADHLEDARRGRGGGLLDGDIAGLAELGQAGLHHAIGEEERVGEHAGAQGYVVERDVWGKLGSDLGDRVRSVALGCVAKPGHEACEQGLGIWIAIGAVWGGELTGCG